MVEKEADAEQAVDEQAVDDKGIVKKALSPHFHITEEDGNTLIRFPVVASLAVVLVNPVIGLGLHGGAWALAKATGNQVGIKHADDLSTVC